MDSEKPLMFLDPATAAAARGQVLVMARVAVMRATDSMVFLIVVVMCSRVIGFFMRIKLGITRSPEFSSKLARQ